MRQYKIFVKSIIFLWILFEALIIQTYILRQNSDKKERFAGFYYQNHNSIDVLYIGSSPVHPYWATPLVWKEFGVTSWALATDVQQPRSIIFLLKEALKYQDPKVAIFELRMFSYPQENFDIASNREASIRNVTDNMKVSWNRIKAVNTLVQDKKERYNYYFDIMKYHSLWKELGQSSYKYWNFECIDFTGGHLINSEVIDLSSSWHNYSGISEAISIPYEQEIELRKLINYCKKKHITALFTVNPYTNITELDQKMFNYIGKIVTEEYHYDFINFNNLYDEVGIDFTADFYNGGHMNTHGAIKYTQYLADYLVKTYGLEDKRGGVGYSDEWDAMYESWKVEADKAIATIEQKVKEGNYDYDE